MVAMIDTSGNSIAAGGANPGAGELAGIGGGGASGLFANNPGLFAALGAAGGAGIGALLGHGGGDLPFGPNVQGTAVGLGAVAQGQRGQSQLANMREGQLFGAGTDLLSSISTGKLPPGAEQSVQNQVQQAQATIKARYGALGQSGSTMEADALSNVENQATAMRFDIAAKMAQLGQATIGQSLTALGLGGAALSSEAGALGSQANIYGNLMQAQMRQDSQMQDSIGRFASSLGQAVGQAAPMMMAASDRRLKSDIKRIGYDPRGFGIYRFRYVWDDEGVRREGYMADEVERVMPEAVSYTSDGYAMLDYAAL